MSMHITVAVGPPAPRYECLKHDDGMNNLESITLSPSHGDQGGELQVYVLFLLADFKNKDVALFYNL